MKKFLKKQIATQKWKILTMNIISDTSAILSRIIISKTNNFSLRPIATWAIYGIKLFGTSCGSSPIIPDWWAPTGLKYRSKVALQSWKKNFCLYFIFLKKQKLLFLTLGPKNFVKLHKKIEKISALWASSSQRPINDYIEFLPWKQADWWPYIFEKPP